MAWRNWLSDMDSNHDKGLQRALCYHYTIGHTVGKATQHRCLCKENYSPELGLQPL